jgi:hypothetical protein
LCPQLLREVILRVVVLPIVLEELVLLSLSDLLLPVGSLELLRDEEKFEEKFEEKRSATKRRNKISLKAE